LISPGPTPISVPFLRSLRIQGRVIGALLMREILTRYGRHNIGFLWLFVEPMLFTLGVMAMWSIRRSTHGTGLSIIPFAITGYSSVLLWRNAANRCSKAIGPNLALLYHRNVAVLDIFTARLLLEIAGATASMIVLLTIFISAGLADLPADPLTMAIAWLWIGVFSAALGLIVGALSERSDTFERIWHTVTYLMFPFSGAVFMVDWFSPNVQRMLLWIPPVNGVEMLRSGYYGAAMRAHYSVTYMLVVVIVMLWVGLLLVRRSSQLVESE
jgi:capsular polysaccharide transport system permease protein